MENLVVEAEPRATRGTNRARQLRRSGKVPAIVYGGAAAPESLSVDPRVVENILVSEAGRNAVFTLAIKGHGKTPAMIRDWQVDPVKGQLLHVDFWRIALDTRLKVKVPVETRGEPVGVKQQDGVLEVVLREVEVECLPRDIPDELSVEVSDLALGKGIRVGDLKVDNRKLSILTDPDQILVHVVAPRAVVEEKPVEEAVPVVGEAAEPELVGKGKEEAKEKEEREKEAPQSAAEGEKK